MPSYIPQTSFTGGELAPALRARQDLTKFGVSLAQCINYIIHTHGGASNRAGLQFVGEIEDSSVVGRVIPFSFSTVQTYTLEFGDLIMRVIKDGAYVLETSFNVSAATQANPVVVTTATHSYSNGDKVYITGVVGMTELNNKFYIIANKTATTFELVGVDGVAFTAYSSGGTAARVFTLTTTYVEVDLTLLKYTQSADVMTITHASYPDRDLTRTDHDAWTITDVTRGTLLVAPASPSATPTTMGTGDTYEYKVTSVAGGDESLATASQSAIGAVAWPAAGYITIAWSSASGADYYNIYKRPYASGSYGFIGSSDTTDFIDDNIQPEYGQTPPPSNNNPFGSANNYASCVAYFQERITLAGTNNKPQTTWMSKTGVYPNMNVSIPPRDDDSIEVTVVAREVNAIRHLVPLNKALIAFSTGSPWAFTGPADGGGITPNNIRADPHGKRGCSDVPPIVIGNQIIYVQEKGQTVRTLEFTENTGLYDGVDLSILASHLFEGHTIKEWAYAEAPHSIIWVVMTDGHLIGLTYLKEHEVWAWHQHNTDGTFESVCSISEGDEDAVYFIVKRVIGGVEKRYVERLHSRYIADIHDAFFVDSGLTFDNPIVVTGATKADPCVVTTDTHGFSNGDKVDFNDVVGMTELNGKRYTIANKTATTFELTDQYSGVDIDSTGFTEYESGGEVRSTVTSVSGAGHLEGKTVAILANGNVHPRKVVTNGIVPLDYDASRIQLGLPYVSDIETLPSEFSGDSNSYGKRRVVEEVVLEILNSRGGWVGYDVDHLTEFKQRGLAAEKYSEPVALFTGKATIAIDSKWRQEGTLFVRQVDPLPITVLGVTPVVDFGE